MIENLQFIQSFRHQQIGPLLSELLEEDEDDGAEESGPFGEDGGGRHNSSAAESSEEVGDITPSKNILMKLFRNYKI